MKLYNVLLNTSFVSGGMVLVLPWVVLTGVGCGTTQLYTGDRLPKDEVATIKPGGTFFFRNVSIAHVNGRTPGFFDREVEVLPGAHEVGITMNRGNQWMQGSVTFTAMRGHIYQVEADSTVTGFLRSAFWVWVEDMETGAVVGGRKPE